MNTPGRHVGQRVPRIEDPALLRGEAQFVDDVKLPGTLHAAFARSPYARTRIGSVDVAEALATPGVLAVFTAEDLAAVLVQPALPLAFPPGALAEEAMPPVLAADTTAFVGEPVAIVVAESRHAAEDGVDALAIDYDPLPPAVDPREALKPGAPEARAEVPGNLFTRLELGFGDADRAFESAPHVFSETLFQTRGVAHPMEGRGILVSPDADGDTLKVWSSTQVAHELRDNIATMLRLEPDVVHVKACSVGGGFGAKFMVYPEEIAVSAAARLLHAPVKWVEDRLEHSLSAIQERDQHWQLEVAVDGDGRLLGVRGEMVQDQGAYAPHNVTVPYNSATALPNAYVLPAYQMMVHVTATNKPPVLPVRGAGYPQGVFAMERLLDRVARELGLAPEEVRRRNLIPADAMPYKSGLRNRAGKEVVYDCGDYLACHDHAVKLADFDGFRARQAEAREAGRHIGIGLAHGVKCTGRGPFETATVRISPTGRVAIYTGAHAIGQGIETALAQICAETLGVRLEDVDVTCGDTRFTAYGIGAFGSRQTMIAGTSVQQASGAVRAKALEVARQLISKEDGVAFSNAQKELSIVDGVVRVSGRPDLGVPLGRIASLLKGAAGYAFPENVSVGLEATESFRVDLMAYSNAVHVCEIEVDPEIGHVQLLRYLAVQDSGTIVNPLIAEGQVQGGVVHGIGNALFEHMRYDEEGQPLTVTLVDYLLPTATDVTDVETVFLQTPSPLNPMGMKGVAEVPVAPVTAAVAAAIDDALAPLGVRICETPITPVRLLELIDAARKSNGGGLQAGAGSQ